MEKTSEYLYTTRDKHWRTVAFSSETPKGEEQRFDKDKVTSYKLPEGLEVQTEKKPNTQEQQPKKKTNKYEIKIYILTHSKWRNDYDDIYFSELKSCISGFFHPRLADIWWRICTAAFQQLLVTRSRMEQGGKSESGEIRAHVMGRDDSVR